MEQVKKRMEEYKKQRSLREMPLQARDYLLESSSSSDEEQATAPSKVSFALGDVVDAKYAEDGKFYEATIEKLYSDG